MDDIFVHDENTKYVYNATWYFNFNFFNFKKSYFDTFSNLVGVISHHILTICYFQQWFVKSLPLMCNNKNLRKKNTTPRSLMSTMLRFTHWCFSKITSHSNVYFEPKIVLSSILLERIEKLHNFLFQNQKHITSHLPYCQRNKGGTFL